MSALREHGDDEMGVLYTAALVSERAARGAGATPPVQNMRADLFRDIAHAETWELVCARSAPLRHRPLATWRDIVAADGRVDAFVVGAAGAL